MLLIKNAQLVGEKNKKDILIKEGIYFKIEDSITPTEDCEIIDAKGDIVTPTFVNPHMHLDKVYTALDGRHSIEETLEESITIMHKAKRNYTVESVKKRAIRAIKDCVGFGTTKIRTSVDIDNIIGLTGLKGVLEAKKECKDICDIQIVAFPQEGLYNNEGTEKLLWEAMEYGADLIGGMPAAEYTDKYSKKHVDLVFEIAKKYDVDIDMHIDQTKDIFARSLEYTAMRSYEEGYQGRVTGGHCTSITYQNDAHAKKVMELLKLVDFNVCTNPQVIAIMGIDSEPRTRGVTRIREMVEMGINIATAQDTICDGFHIFGKGDPLDYGLLLSYVAQYNTPDKVKIVYDMITKNAAKIHRLEGYGIGVGNKADLNIIDAKNLQEAFRTRADRSYVIKDGKVLVRNYSRREYLI
jgi:cytosine deaminase